MPIRRIKIKDMDEAFLQKLRSELENDEAELAIWIPEQPNASALPEDAFWEVIAQLDWTRATSEEDILEPAIHYLSGMPDDAILAFEDFLSEKLYRLDAQVYAENAGENAYRGPEEPFSADEFLYQRCYVVAQGKAFYQRVLGNPEQMPPDESMESLLRLASAAYQRKTGQKLSRVTAFPVETFSNAEGWDGEGLLEKILSE